VNDPVPFVIGMGMGMLFGYFGVAACFTKKIFTHKCSSCGTRVIDHVNGVKVADKTYLCVSCYEQEEKQWGKHLAEKYAVEVNHATT